MRRNSFSRLWITTWFAALVAVLASSASAQRNDDTKFVDAARVLEGFTTNQENGIPADILQRARGIAVIPDMLRGGFLFGGRRGRGVIAIRSPNGEWSNPAFLTLTAEASARSSAPKAPTLCSCSRTIDPFATSQTASSRSAATPRPWPARSGPTRGRSRRDARRSTSTCNRAGLFAGATFEGTRLDIDQDASAAFYRNTNGVPLGAQTPETPAAALPFLDALRSSAVAAPSVTNSGTPPATTPSAPPLTEEEAAVEFSRWNEERASLRDGGDVVRAERSRDDRELGELELRRSNPQIVRGRLCGRNLDAAPAERLGLLGVDVEQSRFRHRGHHRSNRRAEGRRRRGRVAGRRRGA